MSYYWKGMKKVPWESVKAMARDGNTLDSLFFLFADGSEAEIMPGTSWVDIVEHHERGGEFGQKNEIVSLTLPDGKKFTAPSEIDMSEQTDFDSLEYELWHTIESYFSYMGIETEGIDPDWATVKEVQTALLNILERSGVKFKIG